MFEKFPENGDKEEAVKQGYLKTDQDFLKQVIMLILKSLFCFMLLCISVYPYSVCVLLKLMFLPSNCGKIYVPFRIYLRFQFFKTIFTVYLILVHDHV